MSLMDPHPALNGNGPPNVELDRLPASAAMLDAIEKLTRMAVMDTSAAEAKDRASAALDLAKAFILLDPSLTDTGTPLDHEVALEQMRLDSQERQSREKAAQAAQQPQAKNRRLKISRDGNGRMAGAEVSE